MTPWLNIATKVPVTYKTTQMPMQPAVLGAVLHTTNHLAGAETIERFQADWQAGQNQTAHFMVERGGRIGQFRALNEVAWHINERSNQYIGIEHIAKPDVSLTEPQILASADLLAAVQNELGFPLQTLRGPGASGVGIHDQFAETRCGRGVFKGFAATFERILQRAILLGRWEVQVGDWTWIYTFEKSGDVMWQALGTNPLRARGTGTWTLSDKLRIAWDAGSLEEWDIPLKSIGQTGRLTRQGRNNVPLTERERKITARR